MSPATLAADRGNRQHRHLRQQLEQLHPAADHAEHRDEIPLSARHHVYRGEFGTEWQLVLAFITLTILPTVIVFFLAQKHIIAGLTAGAVKS